VISTSILGGTDSNAKSVARGGMSKEKANRHHQRCCCSSSTDQTKVLIFLILRMGQEPKIHRGVVMRCGDIDEREGMEWNENRRTKGVCAFVQSVNSPTFFPSFHGKSLLRRF
jgi:hypothetical protein